MSSRRRFSIQEPRAQNIPIKLTPEQRKLSNEIRELLMETLYPGAKEVFMNVDYSGLEMKMAEQMKKKGEK